MVFTFTDTLPEGTGLNTVLISGDESVALRRRTYLIMSANDTIREVFEIRHKQQYYPFQQAILSDHLLAVGHADCFYLFDIERKECLYKLELTGYYYNFYLNDERWYVADSGSLYCIAKTGGILWKNNELSIDGLYIDAFTDVDIAGHGSWDPSDGWVRFLVDKATGKTLSLVYKSVPDSNNTEFENKAVAGGSVPIPYYKPILLHVLFTCGIVFTLVGVIMLYMNAIATGPLKGWRDHHTIEINGYMVLLLALAAFAYRYYIQQRMKKQ